MKIASLLPSSTEILCALGFEHALVARSHECDYPPTVQKLPIVTAPKFNPDGRSYEVDQRVKAILQEATSVYRVDADTLKSLNPDVIVTQQQCEVCAVSFADVKQVVCDYLGDAAEIISLEPNSLQDVFNDIQRVADTLNAASQGASLIAEMKARMKAIAERAAIEASQPTVASIEWIDPLMAGGNWMPTLVEMAGGKEIFGKAAEHSHWITWEDLKQANPDVLVILPCGYDIPKALSELSALSDRADWGELAAVRNKRVYVTDGNQYFNRPGPRLVESVEILAEILHPDIFSFKHEGRGWIRLEV
jgi:iron complex transport system substrate-binding protein